ncbi:exodeoxyribonuclease VII large subunit [Pleomorphomonas sp. NRKKF1]|uniref:exodeoxyribonuclease VII large subunit n=1 Tax=Pleomorphomonas sp. NRK KF1 TaxID=2943000 RepID=UPI002043FA53|nr:exodeoxyribonuclease VII large subunit [Pleomorphomonas sp. NRK KF1]
MTDPTSNAAEYTVSEISFALKRSIEDQFGFVRVRGEISGYRGPHSSGHAYFALKDEGARMEAVVWRGVMGKLRFKPEEGMEVIATGRLTTYPNSSKYQIVIDALEPAGAGALMALLEERKRKLGAEGLFDPERKQLLPYLPRVIGVVTSPTGAVIRDILHRLADRFPVHVLVWPVKVQGESCGPEVAAGITGFNALPDGGAIPRPDVIIVARGGGSLEDLWGFNDEVVVRAAAASDIPLVSAVGHETDWTLIDLVADVRAPTPTGAAEMVVPVRRELLDRVDDLGRRLTGASLRAIDLRRTRLIAAARALPRASDILALPRQRFDTAANALPKALTANTTLHARRFERVTARLTPASLLRTQAQLAERLSVLSARGGRAIGELIARRRGRLDQVTSVFDAVNHMATLRRGYALVRDDEGKPVFRASGLLSGTPIEIEFSDGRVRGRIGDEPPPPVTEAKPTQRRQKAKPGPEDQGNLF